MVKLLHAADLHLDSAFSALPPEKAAAFLCRVALRRRTKPLYAIGPQYSAAVLLSRLLPCRLVSWIVSRLYAA